MDSIQNLNLPARNVGYVRYIEPNVIRRHKKCPNCESIKHHISEEDYKNRVIKAHGDEYEILSEFKTLKDKIHIKHKKCGKDFWTNAQNFIGCKSKAPCGCPYCAPKSKGELAIRKYLSDNNFIFSEQFSIKNCKVRKALPFDFAIFKSETDKAEKRNPILIEFDGQQHFFVESHSKIYTKDKLEITKKHDKIKTDYCEQNKIPLFRLKYSDLKNINKKLDKIFFKFNDYRKSKD